MKTGKLIEAIMQYRHIGIEELAQKIDMAQPNLSNLIIGNRKITVQLAKKIGDVLDIDPLVIMTNRMCEELRKENNNEL